MINNIDIAGSRLASTSGTMLPVPWTRLVIACFCGAGAVAAVGCGEGRGVPTRPSAAPSASSSLAAKPTGIERPFKGSLELSEIEKGNFPNFTVDSTGGGQATHLGRYTMVAVTELDISRAEDLGLISSASTFTLTAANGDQLTGTLSGVGTLVDVGVSIVDHGIITGGTGRFADATGSFTIQRLLVEATHTSAGSFDGTITY